MRVAAFVAAILLAASTARPAVTLLVGPAVLDIPVVKTVADLQNAEALTTGGAEIRVGIQAHACDTGDGLLVYVNQLSAGDGSAKPPAVDGGSKICAGSVIVEMMPVNEKGARVVLFDDVDDFPTVTAFRDRTFVQKSPGKGLYVCPFHPRAAGAYEIRVSSLDGDLLAKTIVKVDKNRAQPWFPVSLDGKLDEKEKFPLTGTVAPIAAVPNWNGGTPRLAPAHDLPRLVPAESADFHIEAKAGDLSVVIKRNLPSESNHCFLARVWINGAPVLDPKFTEPRTEISHDKIDQLSSPVQFSLRLVLSDLGVGKTDKVEIQLAYCQDGFFSLYGETSNPGSSGEPKDLPAVLVSNKVTVQEATASK